MVAQPGRIDSGQNGEDLGRIGPGVQEGEKEDAGAAAEVTIALPPRAQVHRPYDTPTTAGR